MLSIYLAFAIIVLVYATYEMTEGDIAAVPMIFVSLALIVSWMVVFDLYVSPYAVKWSRLGAQSNGPENVTYFAAILLLYLSAFRTAKNSARKSGSLTSNIRAKEKIRAFLEAVPGGVLMRVTIALALFSALHYAMTDKDVIWLNDRYLTMADAHFHGVSNPLGRFVFSIYKLMGVIAALAWAIAVINGNRKLIVLATIPFLWFLSYEIAGHSRYSVVYAGTVGMLLIMSRSMFQRILGISFLVLSLFALINSLLGRGSGAHGYATLGSFFEYVWLITQVNPLFVFGNMFEGVFVQGEIFLYKGHTFEPIYKNLSFSPFPSFIDGFAQSALHYKLGFRSYVPMSATGEVLLFGPGYMVLYYATIWLSYFVVTSKLNREPSILAFVMVFVFLLASYLQFAYPVRTILRLFYLPLVVFGAMALLSGRKEPAEPTALISRSEMNDTA